MDNLTMKVVQAHTGALPDMPIPAEWIHEGNPQARGVVLIQSADQTQSAGLWECTPGKFEWNFSWHETAHILEGEVTIQEEGGATYTLGVGDFVHFPLGLKTHWHVKRTVRKVFFLKTPEPLQL